jgi:SAM-dependent methyltransferase
VLDLGCGCGVPVARRLSRRYDVTGVDLSPVQIARARDLVPRATFICADMATVEFPDERFDAITCFYALIHLPLEQQPPLLRSVRRWLRPGGIFMATVGSEAWTGYEQDWLGVDGGGAMPTPKRTEHGSPMPASGSSGSHSYRRAQVGTRSCSRRGRRATSAN